MQIKIFDQFRSFDVLHVCVQFKFCVGYVGDVANPCNEVSSCELSINLCYVGLVQSVY